MVVWTYVEKNHKGTSKTVRGNIRHKKSISQTMKRDIELNGLPINMVYDTT